MLFLFLSNIIFIMGLCLYFHDCYSGLNFMDLVLRQGAMESPPKTPFTMGFECAGEVEALGENVDNFNVSNNALPTGSLLK